MGAGTRFTAVIERFRHDRRGVAAVEFAMIAPVLLILYMGGTDATLAVTLHRKLQDAAGTVSDLATQHEIVTKAELTGLMNVARDIMRPYPTDKLGFVIQGVDIDATGKAKVVWSFGQNREAPKKNTAYTLPPEFQNLKDTFIVVSRSEYRYQPIGGYGFSQGIDMAGDATFRARAKKGVRCDDC